MVCFYSIVSLYIFLIFYILITSLIKNVLFFQLVQLCQYCHILKSLTYIFYGLELLFCLLVEKNVTLKEFLKYHCVFYYAKQLMHI